MNNTFGELRSLLQRPPSSSAWAALCEELAAWPAAALRDEALPYAARILERWPSELERWPTELASARWLKEGALDASCLLANAITVHTPAQLATLMELGLDLRTIRITGACTLHIGARYAPLLNALSLRRLLVQTTHARELSDPSALLGALAQPTLRELTVHTSGVNGDLCAVHIALNPTLTGLEVLDMGEAPTETSGVGAHGIEALSSSPSWASLHTLGLGGCPVGHEGVRLITSRPQPWRALNLTGADLSDEDARSIAQSPAMRTVERLLLGNNHLSDESARALADSPHLGALRELELRDNPLTTTGAIALVERLTMPSLVRLGLACDAVYGDLVQHAHPALLHMLELGWEWQINAAMAERLAKDWPPSLALNSLSHDIYADALIHVARWPQLAQLHRLAISGPEGQERLAHAVLASEHLTGIRELSVSHIPAACQVITANPVLANVRWLQLMERTDDAQLHALAVATNMSQLRELILRYTDATADGIRALMQSQCLPQLESLDILSGYGELDVESARCIARRAGLPSLRRLGCCCCDAASLHALLDGDGLCGVEELWIGWGVGDTELRLLAASRFAGAFSRHDEDTGLRTLHLYGGAPTLESLKLLLDHPDTDGLEAIIIENVALGDGLFKLLDGHPHLTKLRALTLRQAALTPLFTRRLARAPWLAQLTHLDLSKNSHDPAFSAPLIKMNKNWKLA
jgi:hypothetical protein